MQQPIESRIRLTEGIELAVFEWPGNGLPLLFCHATSFHARCWDQVIVRLSGRQCYAIDMRGHGRSSKPVPPYRWRAFADDVVVVAQTLGLQQAIAIGHSMGGHAITLAAALAPELFKALLLVDPTLFPPHYFTGFTLDNEATMRRRSRYASPEEMIARFRNRQPFSRWMPEALEDYCRYGLLPEPEGNSFALACPPAVEAAIYQSSVEPESQLTSELTRIALPVWMLRSGWQQPGVTFDFSASPTDPQLTSRMVIARDEIASDHSHFIPMEAPGLVAEMIELLLKYLQLGENLL